jgi:stage V sporulation protein B
MSKNALIKGTLILTLAALVTRVLGVAQRIPLQRVLGDQGMATYGIAYNIYGILLIVATVGIPSALSKQMAEYHALGQYHEANRTYQAARNFSLLAGVITALILYALAPFYAVYISHDPEAVLSIRAIAPALLFFPLISIMRGYFQGLQFMSPPGLSQVSEQILRVGTAVVFPLLLLSTGATREIAVAGASFGAVAGSFGALAVLIFYFKRNSKERKQKIRSQVSFRQLQRKFIYKKLLKTAIPISLASTAIPLIYFIDSSTVISLLSNQLGYDGAKNMLGILTGRAQSLASIPPILAIALSSAVLPAVASAYSRRDLREVERMASLSLRLTLITGAPLALYLFAAAIPVNGFLFSDVQGSWVIAELCLGSIFQMVMMTSMAILQGLGKPSLPMWYVFAGILAKWILNYIFASWLGIYGIVFATTCGFIVILFLHLRAISVVVKDLEVMGPRWKGFFAASVLMVAIIGVVYFIGTFLLPQALPRFLYYGVLCLLTGLIGLPVYGWCLLRLGGITREDMQHLPRKVQRVLARLK